MKNLVEKIGMGIMALMLVLSCTNDGVVFIEQNELQNEDNTRLVFRNFEEFGTYFSSVREENQYVVNTRSSSLSNEIEDYEDYEGKAIVDKFLEYTSMGKIFNSQNEFQIGDTIFKLGNDGYTIYMIDINSYKNAIPYIKSNNSITKKLNEFRKISDCEYELEKGVILWYSGTPLIEIVEMEPIELTAEQQQEIDKLAGISNNNTDNKITIRAGTLVEYRLTVNFWKSSQFFFVGCGPEITYEEKQGGVYKKKNTNLQMVWQSIIIILQDKSSPILAGPITHCGSGTKTDTGSYDKKTFDEKVGVGLNKYAYFLQWGLITGYAQNSNGTWVSRTIGQGL